MAKGKAEMPAHKMPDGGMMPGMKHKGPMMPMPKGKAGKRKG